MILNKKDYIRLYNQYEKPASTIFHKYISKKLAKFFTYFFLYFEVTPNIISVLTFFLLIISFCLLFIVDGFLGQFLFLILMQVSYAFDCSDGVVARITKNTSSFGAYLDITLDRLNILILFAGLGIYLNMNNNISVEANVIFILSAIFYYQYQIMALLRANYFPDLNGYMKQKSKKNVKKIVILYVYELIDTGIFYFIISLSLFFNLLFFAVVFYGFLGLLMSIALYIFLFKTSTVHND